MQGIINYNNIIKNFALRLLNQYYFSFDVTTDEDHSICCQFWGEEPTEKLNFMELAYNYTVKNILPMTRSSLDAL